MNLADAKYVENIQCRSVSDINLNSIPVSEMIEYCESHNGVGLAAPQVGIPLKFFIALDLENRTWNLFINPSYKPIGNAFETKEGCLTYPGEHYIVNRFSKIIATWYVCHEKLEKFSKTMDLLQAQIFQHETDHCEGRTIATIGRKVYERDIKLE